MGGRLGRGQELDAAAVVLDEAARDGQAEAGAPLLPQRDERLEHPLADLLRHAGALVRQLDQQVVGRGAAAVARLDAHPQRERAVAAHRVARVRGDVGHRPPQLVDVERHAPHGVEAELAGDLQPGQLLLDAGRQLGEEDPERHRAQYEPLRAAGEIERLAGHPLEPVGRLDDQRRAGGDLRFRHARLEQRLGVAADHRHRPAEVVRQHPGHRAERRQPLRGDQLFLVGVVLERERRAPGDHGHEPRLPIRDRAPPPLHRAERQRPGESRAREQRHEDAFTALAGGLEQLAVGEQPARRLAVRRRRQRLEPAQRAAVRELDTVEALEPAVPQQERRATGAERSRQLDRQVARERRQVGGLQDAARDAPERLVSLRCRR